MYIHTHIYVYIYIYIYIYIYMYMYKYMYAYNECPSTLCKLHVKSARLIQMRRKIMSINGNRLICKYVV